MVKKRGIAKKPTDQAASDWVAAGGADPEISPASTPAPETLAKSKDPKFTRSTLYLSKVLHKRLRLAAVNQDTEMSDIAEAAIADWLGKHSDV